MSFPYWEICPSKVKAQALHSNFYKDLGQKFSQLFFFFYSESIKKDINMISEK